MGLRRLGLVVLALGAIVCAGYWAILSTQPAGGPGAGLVAYLVTGLILLPAAGCAAGAWNPGSSWQRLLLLGWSALTLLALAVIAVFSIGILVLPVALLTVAALVLVARRGWRGWALPAVVLGSTLGVATVVAFVSVEPFLPPTCPGPGDLTAESGWPAGLFTPAVTVTYTCHDGRLVTWTTRTGS